MITAPIFDDCIVCGSPRVKNDGNCILLRKKKHRITIIKCECTRAMLHEDLTPEVELIDFLAAADIIIT